MCLFLVNLGLYSDGEVVYKVFMGGKTDLKWEYLNETGIYNDSLIVEFDSISISEVITVKQYYGFLNWLEKNKLLNLSIYAKPNYEVLPKCVRKCYFKRNSNLPMIGVDWFQAQLFAFWTSCINSNKYFYRLPYLGELLFINNKISVDNSNILKDFFSEINIWVFNSFDETLLESERSKNSIYETLFHGNFFSRSEKKSLVRKIVFGRSILFKTSDDNLLSNTYYGNDSYCNVGFRIVKITHESELKLRRMFNSEAQIDNHPLLKFYSNEYKELLKICK